MKETKTKSVVSGAKVSTGVSRGKVNGYSNAKLHARRDARRIKAESLQREHSQLTVEEKIAKAKSRRGESKKEINRLEKLLANLGKPLVKPVIAKPAEIKPVSQEAPPITEKKKRVKKPKVDKIEVK